MKYLFILLIFLCTANLQAQYDTIYMAILPFKSKTKIGEAFVKAARLDAIKAINTDYRIHRVDRSLTDAVKQEREYQKSEDFLDGRIVEQGKAVGADYVMDGVYDHNTKDLIINIYEVSTGNLKCSTIPKEIIDLKEVKRKGISNWVNQSDLISYDKATKTKYAGERWFFPSPNVVKSNVKKLLFDCFPEKSWAVLRPTSESKSKVKELLIAAGSRMGLTRKTYIDILVVIKEEVDGVTLDRLESVGWGKVEKVEGENFSVVKVEAGGKNMKKYLAEGNKLRCRFVKQ